MKLKSKNKIYKFLILSFLLVVFALPFDSQGAGIKDILFQNPLIENIVNYNYYIITNPQLLASPALSSRPVPENCDTYGDIKSDAQITAEDRDRIMAYIAGLPNPDTATGEWLPHQIIRMDVNGDGEADVIDALIIQNYLDEVINTFPVCLTKVRESPCFPYGDVDTGGEVSLIDAWRIDEHVTGLFPIFLEGLKERADVDNDGEITIVDALLVAQYSNGLVDDFPVCTAEVGEECGGGTDMVPGLGPVVEMETCLSCQELATCSGNKTGYDDVAYLWDSVTKKCGLGVPMSQDIIEECQEPTIVPLPPGQIPTPCPKEEEGTAVLKGYMIENFNIRFLEAGGASWSTGSLYDICQKLHETSGTKFDDFFRSDLTDTEDFWISGGLPSYCNASNFREVFCGAGTGLHLARGDMVTFNVFHELSHEIKDWVGLIGSGESQIETVATNDFGKAIWNDPAILIPSLHGHISIYPYSEHIGTSTCGSSWATEEYADTVAYYLHSGLNQISPLCGNAPKPQIPYKDATTPDHCTLMYNKLGAYSPYCANTLGTWQIHSPVCESTDLGACRSTLMLSFFDTHAADAVQICRKESSGNPWTLNDGCLTAETADYSVGLFQINLLPRCPLGIAWTGDFSNPKCWIINNNELKKCEEKYGLGDPVTNASQAFIIAQGGLNWCPWSTASPSYCQLCPHP